MIKIKKHLIQEIKYKRKNIKELYLTKGYDLAIKDLKTLFKNKVIENKCNKPSDLDLLMDLDLVEDRKYKSIDKENAIKLFYYKLGWDRGNNRTLDISLNNQNILLKNIV